MYVEYKNINRTTHMQAAVKRLAAQTHRAFYRRQQSTSYSHKVFSFKYHLKVAINKKIMPGT